MNGIWANLVLLANNPPADPEGMTPQAWIFMLLIWAVILSMTGFCFFKLLTSTRSLGDDDE